MGIVHASSAGLEDTRIRSAKSPKPDFSLVNSDLGNVYTTKSYDLDISASGIESYVIESGSLPTGLSLNGATGRIVGTPTGYSDFDVDNIFNFSVRAFSKTGSIVKDFTINANSIMVGYTCFSSGGGVLCGDMPTGYVIKRIDYAVWGRPNGSCGSYSNGFCGCGIPLSGFIGQPGFCYDLFNGWCGDPCPGYPKWAYIQMSYGPA